MPTYPTNKDNDISLLKKIADNTGEIAAGSGGGGGIGAVDSVNAQTGVVVLDKTDIGLPNVDDTSDADKPISTATQTALDALGDEVDSIIIQQPTSTGNRLVSNVSVIPEGLTINVGPAEYIIQGQSYSSPATVLTLDSADATHSRIDVIALTSSNTAIKITGTPATPPGRPDIDPTTQLEVTFFLVEANATSVTGSETEIYRENTEWTMTEQGTSIDLASTTGERTGATCIEATAMAATDYFQGQAPSPIDLSDSNYLALFIDSKAAWPNNKQLTITARNAGVQVGNPVTFKSGTFGFDSSLTVYQPIVIPTSLFGADGQTVNQIRFTCQGGGAAIGFFIDDITLQGSAATTSDNTRMRFRFGGWHDDVAYSSNDTLVHNDAQYVAKRSNILKDPFTSTDDWERSSGIAIKPFCISFNPKAVCDGTIDRLFLMKVGPDCPNGLKIVRWDVSFDADPTTEADLDLKRADAYIGVANAAVMDVLDTTAGVSTETTASNINAGATVANGKVIYLEFGTAYTVDSLQITFQMWYYAV